jgi:hypothetical protein
MCIFLCGSKTSFISEARSKLQVNAQPQPTEAGTQCIYTQFIKKQMHFTNNRLMQPEKEPQL